MNLATFLVEIRSRHGSLPRPESLHQSLVTLTGLAVLPGPQGQAVLRVLGCLADPEARVDLAFRELAALGPLALTALDSVIDEMLEGRCSPEMVQKAIGLGAK